MSNPAINHHLFQPFVKLVFFGFTGALIWGHAALNWDHLFVFSAVFSVLMNLTYPLWSLVHRQSVREELMIAGVLISLSIAALWLSPWLLIFAIIGHGIWDLLKHRHGAGIAFFDWYCLGCVAVDFTWAAVLAFLVLQGV